MNNSPSIMEIADYCNNRLSVYDYHDFGLNGVQYEGQRPITTICAAVDASLEAVMLAAEQGAEALLVHHGLFWGKNPVPLTGRIGQIVRALVENDISLLAYHLPLDGHDELGNNRQLANELSLQQQLKFAKEGRVYMAVAGNLPEPIGLDSLAGNISNILGTNAHGYCFNQEPIKRLAICSGRGVSEEWLLEAQELGCQAYLTGEIVYEQLMAAQHAGMNIITAGHYHTERSGVQVLGQELAVKFGLNYRFLELPSASSLDI